MTTNAVSTEDVDAFAQIHEDSEHNEDVFTFPLASEHTSSKDNDVDNEHPKDNDDSSPYAKQATIASLPASSSGNAHDTGSTSNLVNSSTAITHDHSKPRIS